MKLNNLTFGRAGELISEKYLTSHGWKVVANNYAVPGGELDLVAYKLGVLAFVEVKTRSSDTFGSPADAVNERKKKCLHHAAKLFLEEQMEYGCIPVYNKLLRKQTQRYIRKKRFDIIEVYMDRSGENVKINHIKNAF